MPYYTFNSSTDSLDPRHIRQIELYNKGIRGDFNYNKKHYLWNKKYRRPTYDEFLYDESSNMNLQYAAPEHYDASDFEVDRQANSNSHPMVDKIFITTPPPELTNMGQFMPNQMMPSFAPPLPPKMPNAPPLRLATKQALQKRKKVSPQKMQASPARINVRFITPKPRFQNYQSFTTPFPMKRPMFKQTESVKMIQVPMNSMSDNDVQIMLRPKPTLKGGAPAPTPEMEHSIKAKTQQTGLLGLYNKKRALKEALWKKLLQEESKKPKLN